MKRTLPSLAGLPALAALAGLLVVLLGCGAAADPTPARVIDVHTHAAFAGGDSAAGDRPYTREQLLTEWEAGRVVGAVVHLPRDSVRPGDLPGRVKYCAGIGDTPDAGAVEAGLRSGALSCIKIYLGYVHRFAYDPAYDTLYALAAAYEVPVVFHTGDTSTAGALLKYAHPLSIDEVAVAHRGVNFVIGHCGNPWIETAAEVAYKNPNVYIECSALMTGDMDALPKAAVERYVIEAIEYVLGYLEDPGKLMFGSDWPLVEIEPYIRAYMAAVPPEYRDRVFHDNAARVFGF